MPPLNTKEEKNKEVGLVPEHETQRRVLADRNKPDFGGHVFLETIPRGPDVKTSLLYPVNQSSLFEPPGLGLSDLDSGSYTCSPCWFVGFLRVSSHSPKT